MSSDNLLNGKKVIGISFGVPSDPISMFSNGIRQNVLYFFEVLYLLGHDVYLITDKPLIKGIYNFDYDKYKTVVFENDLCNKIKFDICFQVGFQYTYEFMKKIKEQGCKLISYKCSNDYIFDMEHVLFTTTPVDWPQHSNIPQPIFDQIWIIPQIESMCLHYFKTIYRCPIITVPFIWSPDTITKMCEPLSNKGLYFKRDGKKKIAIFEPNLNVVKYALPAVLVCENAHRNDPNVIEKVYVTNVLGKTPEQPTDTSLEKSTEDKKPASYGNFCTLQFSRMTYSLDLYLHKKLFVEARHQTVIFMSNYADIAVSHQWENPLNYLYLDIAWMGWPIVHNAYLCKDIGYYYEGFNYENGGEILNHVIETHDENAGDYLKRNRQIIDRYLPTNRKLQQTYRELIDSIFK